jgi:hypothetical protein
VHKYAEAKEIPDKHRKSDFEKNRGETINQCTPAQQSASRIASRLAMRIIGNHNRTASKIIGNHNPTVC